MKRLKLEQTDVFIEDGPVAGQVKITVSDPWMGAFTYAWGGAMGSGIEEFLSSIDPDYFANKLCRTDEVFDAKQSVSNIRKYIREELKHELPFYKYPELQKEMRSNLKEMEQECDTEQEFVDSCMRFSDGIICAEASYREENEFKEILDGVFRNEPWNFIAKKASKEYIWLKEIHGKIKGALRPFDKAQGAQAQGPEAKESVDFIIEQMDPIRVRFRSGESKNVTERELRKMQSSMTYRTNF